MRKQIIEEYRQSHNMSFKYQARFRSLRFALLSALFILCFSTIASSQDDEIKNKIIYAIRVDDAVGDHRFTLEDGNIVNSKAIVTFRFLNNKETNWTLKFDTKPNGAIINKVEDGITPYTDEGFKFKSFINLQIQIPVEKQENSFQFEYTLEPEATGQPKKGSITFKEPLSIALKNQETALRKSIQAEIRTEIERTVREGLESNIWWSKFFQIANALVFILGSIIWLIIFSRKFIPAVKNFLENRDRSRKRKDTAKELTTLPALLSTSDEENSSAEKPGEIDKVESFKLELIQALNSKDEKRFSVIKETVENSNSELIQALNSKYGEILSATIKANIKNSLPQEPSNIEQIFKEIQTSLKDIKDKLPEHVPAKAEPAEIDKQTKATLESSPKKIIKYVNKFAVNISKQIVQDTSEKLVELIKKTAVLTSEVSDKFQLERNDGSFGEINDGVNFDKQSDSEHLADKSRGQRDVFSKVVEIESTPNERNDKHKIDNGPDTDIDTEDPVSLPAIEKSDESPPWIVEEIENINKRQVSLHRYIIHLKTFAPATSDACKSYEKSGNEHAQKYIDELYKEKPKERELMEKAKAKLEWFHEHIVSFVIKKSIDEVSKHKQELKEPFEELLDSFNLKTSTPQRDEPYNSKKHEKIDSIEIKPENTFENANRYYVIDKVLSPLVYFDDENNPLIHAKVIVRTRY